jgi:iron(III) transport system permease protein
MSSTTQEPGRAAVRRRAPWAKLLILVLVGVPVLVPILYVIVSSVSDSFPGEALNWSTAPWERAFDSGRTLESLLVSLVLTLRVPISMAVALCFAWFLVRVDIPGRKFVMYALWTAFFLPVLPMTFGWMLLINGNSGLLNQLLDRLPFIDGPLFNLETIPGIMWVHITLTTIPIMTILLVPAMRAIDSSYEEASDIAGARTSTTIRRITLPLLAPAVLVSLLAGFIRSLETFEVEQILGTPAEIFVYSTRIFNLLRSSPPDYAQAMALSTFLLVILVAVALLYQRVQSRYADNATLGGKGVRVRERPRTAGTWLAAVALYAAVAVCIVGPLAMLIAGSFTKLFGFFFIDQPWTLGHWTSVLTDSDFVGALKNSAVVALTVGLVGTFLFALLGTVFARSRDRLTRWISLAAWLPWAVPGLLMGVAYLTVFLIVPGLASWLQTLLPLIIVLLVQSLPLGSMMMQSAVTQVSPELEEASYGTGAGWWRTYFRITLPLVAPMAVTVFVITFMSAIRDISSTVLLAAPGHSTLSLLMFEYANGSEPEAAAVVGVIIALISLAMTAVVLRIGERLSVN